MDWPRGFWNWLFGGPPPPAELARLDDLATRAPDASGGFAGDGTAQPGMGLDFLPPQQRSVVFKVIGVSNAPSYDCVEVVDNGGTGSESETFQEVEGGVGSTAAPVHAYEANGNPFVPVNTIVTGWPTESQEDGADGWRFWYSGSAAPSTLKVDQYDGLPPVYPVNWLSFNQADGFKVEQIAPLHAGVKLTTPVCLGNVVITERDPRCVGVVPTVFRRDNTLSLTTGPGGVCLKLKPGAWFREHTVYCCPCGSGSGSGSGICIPGICPYCTDPPYAWSIIVAGFTGNCDVFNGKWDLFNAASCLWSYSTIVAGQVLTIIITLDAAGTVTLLMDYGPNNAAIASVTYSGNLDLANCPGLCCEGVILTLDDCQGCRGATSPTGCAVCANGITPTSWDVVMSGFFGCLGNLNGSYTLTQIDNCTWGVFIIPGAIITLQLAEGGGTFEATVVDAGGTPIGTIAGIAPPNDPESGGFNCCEPLEVTILSANCADGSRPPPFNGSVLLRPTCDQTHPPSGSGSGCPPEIPASPSCCSGFQDCRSGSGGPNNTVCQCGSSFVSPHLLANFSDGGGLPGAFGGAALLWNPSSGSWIGSGNLQVPGCDHNILLHLEVFCETNCDGWRVRITPASCFSTPEQCFSLDKCSPFHITGHVAWFPTSDCCVAPGTMIAALDISIVEV